MTFTKKKIFPWTPKNYEDIHVVGYGGKKIIPFKKHFDNYIPKYKINDSVRYKTNDSADWRIGKILAVIHDNKYGYEIASISLNDTIRIEDDNQIMPMTMYDNDKDEDTDEDDDLRYNPTMKLKETIQNEFLEEVLNDSLEKEIKSFS